jgi:uncharacterized membrane protein required for colicin V production
MIYLSYVIFAAILIYFSFRGYKKGFAPSIVRIIGIIAAYVASYFFIIPASKFAVQYFAIEGLMVYFVIGSVIFFVAAIFTETLLGKLLQRFSVEMNIVFVSNASRISGATLGFFVGCVVGLIAVYLINFQLAAKSLTTEKTSLSLAGDASKSDNIQASQISGETANYSADAVIQPEKPLPKESFINATAKKFVGKATVATLSLATKDQTTIQMAKIVASNPQVAIESVKRISNDQQIINFMSDSYVEGILNRGDLNELLNSYKFGMLMRNPNMQPIIKIVASDNSVGKKSEQIIAEAMINGWKRMNAIKNDPRVIAIISDQEFQNQLNSGNTLLLLRSEKFKNLVEIIFANDQLKTN